MDLNQLKAKRAKLQKELREVNKAIAKAIEDNINKTQLMFFPPNEEK